MMNILLVTFEFPPYTPAGGIGTYMLHLSKLLLGQGERVIVFSALPGAEAIKEVHGNNYSHFYVPAIDNLEFQDKALRLFETFIENNQVDVIESPEVGACAIEIKRKYPHIPLVVKLHAPGVLITKISRYHQPLTAKLRFVLGAFLRGRIDWGYWSSKDKNKLQDKEYQICAMADLITSPSYALKRWVADFWDLPERKIKVVPNPFYPEDALFALPIRKHTKQICFIGKLSILKGMVNLTAAIPRILDANPDYRIVLVGRDEVENGYSMKAYMEQKLSAYKDRVLFTGPLSADDVKNGYASSDLCLVPSLWENHPTVVLEGMASGTTVVASNCGGIPEIITEGINGILFDPRKPRSIAKKVNALLADKNRRLALADNARKTLLARLKEGAVNQEVINTYRTVAKVEYVNAD
jgi:glycosyltransferase involved in cell wall biosynthesis